MSNASDIEKYQQQLTEYRRELMHCMKIDALSGINTPYEVKARINTWMERIRAIQLQLQQLGVNEAEETKSE